LENCFPAIWLTLRQCLTGQASHFGLRFEYGKATSQ
jgi:hypothetical protein